MIFLTIGHQRPFDRLIMAVDAWAEKHGRRDIFGQIGNGTYVPKNMQFAAYMSPRDYRACTIDASAIVSHAGIGSIIAALQLRKPLLVVPRLESLREATSDHQVATARRYASEGYALAAYSYMEIQDGLDKLITLDPKAYVEAGTASQISARISTLLFGSDSTAGTTEAPSES